MILFLIKPLDDLFDKVDKVVVFTSLGGFEALIRGISVTTYGFPFYAGWGLTEDKLIYLINGQKEEQGN